MHIYTQIHTVNYDYPGEFNGRNRLLISLKMIEALEINEKCIWGQIFRGRGSKQNDMNTGRQCLQINQRVEKRKDE